jgi:hypothetical protein
MARQEYSHMGSFLCQHALDQIDGRIGEIVVFGFFPVNSSPGQLYRVMSAATVQGLPSK